MQKSGNVSNNDEEEEKENVTVADKLYKENA